MSLTRKYTVFDFENLVELYTKNNWLRSQANHEGLEDLWFDYNTEPEKLIIKNLIINFKYLNQEEAEQIIKNKLIQCIRKWDIKPSNTLFMGFSEHKFPDGSSILLNFFKAILTSIDSGWREFNFLPDFDYGKGRIKDDGFTRWGLKLEKIVLVDDFVGTGGSAIKKIEKIEDTIRKNNKNIDLTMFSLAAMLAGKMRIGRKSSIDFVSGLVLKKGTTLCYDLSERSLRKDDLRAMESILFDGSSDFLLKDHSLGYGKSESLYSWNRFNIPNNNYPIFWWHRYLDESKRKTMFNRCQ